MSCKEVYMEKVCGMSMFENCQWIFSIIRLVKYSFIQSELSPNVNNSVDVTVRVFLFLVITWGLFEMAALGVSLHTTVMPSDQLAVRSLDRLRRLMVKRFVLDQLPIDLVTEMLNILDWFWDSRDVWWKRSFWSNWFKIQWNVCLWQEIKCRD